MKRRDEVTVGILLTVAVIVLVLGMLWLVRGGLSRGYPLHTRFPWGQNLKQGQPVMLAGVTIGYVANVELDPNGTLLVHMSIDEQYRIPEGSTSRVIGVGIFGDRAIAVMPRGPSSRSMPEGDTIPSTPSQPTTEQMLAKVDTIGQSVADVARKFEVELVQRGGIEDLRNTLASTNRLVAQLSTIASEQSRQMTLTMASLRRSAAAIDSASIDSTVRNLQTTSANMSAITADLRTTTTQLNSVLAKIDDGTGTAGKLVNDSLLYRDMRSLVTRLDSLTADFKKNPRRYINLEIF